MPPIIFDDGEQTRDFVFVGDAVRATVASLRKPLPGGTILNVGTGKPTSIKLLAEKVLGNLKLYHVHPTYAPGRLGDVRNSEADTALSHKMIDFRPKCKLDEGLRATINWLKRLQGQNVRKRRHPETLSCDAIGEGVLSRCS